MRFSLRRHALAFAVAAAPLWVAGALPAAQAATTPNCGTTIAKSGGGTWVCTFDDEFSGSALDATKWIAQQTATSGYTNGPTACYVDTRNNVWVGSGSLKLTARKESAPFTCVDPYGDFTTQYTSGMVSTYGRFSQAYGRFEIRAKVSSSRVKGLQEALWLWPQDPARYGTWPASGEIDMAELYSSYPDHAIPYVHYDAAAFDPNVTNTNCLVSNVGSFHRYVVEWTPLTIKVAYDGTTCLIDDWNPASPLIKPQPFDQPFIVALTQALGVGSNAFDPATTVLPATTTVDYVRVWK